MASATNIDQVSLSREDMISISFSAVQYGLTDSRRICKGSAWFQIWVSELVLALFILHNDEEPRMGFTECTNCGSEPKLPVWRVNALTISKPTACLTLYCWTRPHHANNYTSIFSTVNTFLVKITQNNMCQRLSCIVFFSIKSTLACAPLFSSHWFHWKYSTFVNTGQNVTADQNILSETFPGTVSLRDDYQEWWPLVWRITTGRWLTLVNILDKHPLTRVCVPSILQGYQSDLWCLSTYSPVPLQCCHSNLITMSVELTMG